MNIHLTEAIKSITVAEIKFALAEIQQYSPLWRQDVYQVHASRIRQEFLGFSRLLNIEPDNEIEVLNPAKVDGYRFAASLVVTVAENRKAPALKDALVAIQPDEFMNSFCEIIEGEPDQLISNQVASRVRFPGFCSGISVAFSFLDAGGEHLAQMSIGLTIFVGVILALADDS